jgi:hypothetical protein
LFNLVSDVHALIVALFNASDGYFRYHHKTSTSTAGVATV